MKLVDCIEGFEYKIIKVEDENKRLKSLGFTENMSIKLLYKNKRSLVVGVLGVVYSLETKLASKIIVIKVR